MRTSAHKNMLANQGPNHKTRVHECTVARESTKCSRCLGRTVLQARSHACISPSSRRHCKRPLLLFPWVGIVLFAVHLAACVNDIPIISLTPSVANIGKAGRLTCTAGTRGKRLDAPGTRARPGCYVEVFKLQPPVPVKRCMFGRLAPLALGRRCLALLDGLRLLPWKLDAAGGAEPACKQNANANGVRHLGSLASRQALMLRHAAITSTPWIRSRLNRGAPTHIHGRVAYMDQDRHK